jgi:hypothetical protein
MNTQANAKASVSRCHPGLQETFDQHDGDHHDGNDDLGKIGGLEYADRAPAVTTPAPLAYSGVEPFDDHLAWGESGQKDHQGANDDSLRIMADRVRARAVRRAGELLKQLNSTRARTDLDLVVVAKPFGHDDRNEVYQCAQEIRSRPTDKRGPAGTLRSARPGSPCDENLRWLISHTPGRAGCACREPCARVCR